jgi:hypothetical protein
MRVTLRMTRGMGDSCVDMRWEKNAAGICRFWRCCNAIRFENDLFLKPRPYVVCRF